MRRWRMSRFAAVSVAERRAMLEALLLVPSEFAGAFGDVEDDRGGRASERVLEVGASRRQEGVDLVDEVEEVERAAVDVELGVVEWQEAWIGSRQDGLPIRIDDGPGP